MANQTITPFPEQSSQRWPLTSAQQDALALAKKRSLAFRLGRELTAREMTATKAQPAMLTPSTYEPAKNPILDKLDDIPPGLMGYLAIPAAIGVAYLPKLISNVMDGDLSTSEQGLISKIGGTENPKVGMHMYSKEEYASKVKHAQTLLDRFANEGDEWLMNSKQMKYFMDSHHFNRHTKEQSKRYLKQHIIMDAMNLVHGRDFHPLQDMDGTQVFKAFSNSTNGVEANISDQDRLAHVLKIGYNYASRRGLEASADFVNDPKHSTYQIVQDLKRSGFFKADKLSQEQFDTYLDEWSKNSDAAFKPMTPEERAYYIKSSIESANTARAGLQVTTNGEALPPQYNLGINVLPQKFDPKPQVGFYELLGIQPRPGLPIQYSFDINGYQGRTVADKQVFVPLETINTNFAGLHDILYKTGLSEKLFGNDTLPRQAEHKGNYTKYTQGIVKEHLSRRLDSMFENKKELGNFISSHNEHYDDPITGDAFKALDPQKQMEKLIFIDKKTNNKSAFTIPLSWDRGMGQLKEHAMYLLSEAKLGKKNVSYKDVWKLLDARTQGLTDADHDYFDLPLYDHGQTNSGTVIPNPTRIAKAEKYMQEHLDADGHAPIAMAKNDLARIKAGLAEVGHGDSEHQKLTTLLKDIQTVDWGCFTVHTLMADLEGVYATIQQMEKRLEGKEPDDLTVANLESSVLENGKCEVLARIIELEKDPSVKQALKEQGFEHMLKVESSSPELCYKNNEPGEAMINIINNSSSDYTHEIYPNIEKATAKAHGYTIQYDPTASYVEMVLGQKIDKGAVIPPLHARERVMHMAGDSTGSDMNAIAWLSSLSPTNTSEVVRGMIDYNKLMNSMIGINDVKSKNQMTQKLIGAYRKDYARDGMPQAHIDKIIERFEEQVMANPMRYEKIKDDAGAFSHIQLVGKGHEKVLERMGLENRFTESSYRNMYEKVYNDVMLPKVYFADDVAHKHLRDILAKAFVHGDEDPILRVIKSNKLAGQALDMIPGFENRSAFSLGIPFHATHTLQDWSLKIHRTAMNAFNPVHKFLLDSNPLAVKGAEAGALMAFAGGVVAAGVTLLQLREHAKYQNLPEWDRDIAEKRKKDTLKELNVPSQSDQNKTRAELIKKINDSQQTLMITQGTSKTPSQGGGNDFYV